MSHIIAQRAGSSDSVSRKPKDTTFLETYLTQTPALTKCIMNLLAESNNEEIPVSLTWVFVVSGAGSRLGRFCIETEIGNSSDYALLLREETAYVRVLSTFIQLEGHTYVKSVVAKVLKNICNPKYGTLEIDPNRVGSPEELNHNRQMLLKVCKEMFDTFVKSVAKVPLNVREMLNLAYNAATSKFSESAYKVLGSCFFLRFVVPNIVQPERYNLLKTETTPEIRRKLILCSKVLQLIANELEPTDKEQYMVDAGLGTFITQNIKKLHKFYEKLIKVKGAKRFGNLISEMNAADLRRVYVLGHSYEVYMWISSNFDSISQALDAKSKTPKQAETIKEELGQVLNDCMTKRVKRSMPALSESLL